jgi:hypothetical protein
MVEAVANSLRYLMREDITALAAYLRHVEPQDGCAAVSAFS